MLNATFGNSVETLISVVALMKAKDARAAGDFKQASFFFQLVQNSLLGSMLSNLLLVQGTAFFVGGLRHPMQTFSREGAVTSAGLLVLATLALSVPTMLWTNQDQIAPTNNQLGLSRFVSICLLIIYLCFLLFQLRTHRFLFERATEIHKAHVEFDVVTKEPSMMNIIPLPQGSSNRAQDTFDEVELTSTAVNGPPVNTNGSAKTKKKKTSSRIAVASDDDSDNEPDEEEGREGALAEDVTRPPIPIVAPINNHLTSSKIEETARPRAGAGVNGSLSSRPVAGQTVTPHHHEAQIGLVFATIYLLTSTVAVAFVSHVIVEAAEGAVDSLHLNPFFIGGVVVPIVGNAAEHASSLMFAWKDRMDTALAIAVGSAIQIPLFIMPVCVLTGWAAEVPFTLNLDQFMMTIVVVTSLALAFTLHAGASHWLHGLILIFEYLIIAAAFWFREWDAT
jgi:Ca2+:H+ antiporter